MKKTNRVRLLTQAVVAAAAVSARANVTYLNQFAPLTSGFDPFYVGSGPNGQVVVTDYQDSKGFYYGTDGSFQGNLVKGAGTPLNGLDSPYYATVGYDGNYYVSNNTFDAVEIFGPNGVETSVIQSTNFTTILGIAESSSGTIYTQSPTTLYAYKTNGQFEFSASLSQSSTNTYQLTLDASGSNLYLADAGDNRIDVYSSAGNSEGNFGAASGPGQLKSPFGVAVSATGLVYVGDTNAGIKVFNASGTYLQTVATTVGTQSFSAFSLAVNPLGMIYSTVTTVSSVYRFFDPASWAAGTNNFTNSNTGPTSVAVGSGGLMGSLLTINSNMGLVVGATTTVNDGGVLSLNGGGLNTGSLVIDGTTGGASFTDTSGSLSASTITVSNGGVADIVGSPLSVILSGNVSISGSSSQFKVDQGAIFSTTGLTNTGQVYVGTGADLIVYNNTTNGGTINLGGGELDIRGTLENSAGQIIQGTGTISTTLGLTNDGTLALAGSTSVNSSLVNNSDGLIHLSGTAQNVFLDPVANNGTLTVDAGADGTFYGTYSGTGSIKNNGSLYLNAAAVSGSVTGSGILNLGNNSLAVNLKLNVGSGVSAQGGLNISSGSSLDLTSNIFHLNYGSSDPISSVRSYLAGGYNGGNWNGAGINSSAVAGLNVEQSALIYSIGYADGADGITGVPSGEIEIMPTLAGDAKMQGNVVFGDFQLLSQYFGQNGTSWDEGNFTYGSATNFGDFQLLSQNFGANSSALTAGEMASLDGFAAQFGDGLKANAGGGFSLVSVPEPASIGLLAFAGFSLLGRRQRRR